MTDFDPSTYKPMQMNVVELPNPLLDRLTPMVGKTFTASGDQTLTLVAAAPSVKFCVAPGQCAPDDVPVGVQLVFEAASTSALLLPEGNYHVEGEGLCAELYLIPVLTAEGSPQRYQAVYGG